MFRNVANRTEYITIHLLISVHTSTVV